MKLGEIAQKIWKVLGSTGEVLDFVGDVIIGKSIITGKTAFKGEGGEKGGEKIPPIEKIKTHLANIGRGDEAIIARLLGKLEDKDRAIFLGFKIWLSGEDRVKYFILRRHLAYIYEKGEKEALETILDIVSKLEAGGNKATLEYCNGMEITYDSTIALILDVSNLLKNGAVPVNRQINRTARRVTAEAIGLMRRREVAIANRPFWKFW
jgi:hypothetical protein